MANTHVCRICKYKEGNKCLQGYQTRPDKKEDCMYFRHKEDKYDFQLGLVNLLEIDCLITGNINYLIYST